MQAHLNFRRGADKLNKLPSHRPGGIPRNGIGSVLHQLSLRAERLLWLRRSKSSRPRLPNCNLQVSFPSCIWTRFRKASDPGTCSKATKQGYLVTEIGELHVRCFRVKPCARMAQSQRFSNMNISKISTGKSPEEPILSRESLAAREPSGDRIMLARSSLQTPSPISTRLPIREADNSFKTISIQFQYTVPGGN